MLRLYRANGFRSAFRQSQYGSAARYVKILRNVLYIIFSFRKRKRIPIYDLNTSTVYVIPKRYAMGGKYGKENFTCSLGLRKSVDTNVLLNYQVFCREIG